jgi:hypothetical protein
MVYCKSCKYYKQGVTIVGGYQPVSHWCNCPVHTKVVRDPICESHSMGNCLKINARNDCPDFSQVALFDLIGREGHK